MQPRSASSKAFLHAHRRLIDSALVALVSLAFLYSILLGNTTMLSPLNFMRREQKITQASMKPTNSPTILETHLQLAHNSLAKATKRIGKDD